MAPQPGTRLPDFALKLATKEGIKDFRLSEHLGGGPVVLAFYPLAFTGTCTKEMCDFRDNLGRFEGIGAKVFGFSTDTPFANVEFAKAHNLATPIVSDPNREVVGKVWETATVAGVANVAKRGVLVLGPDGAVKWASVSEDPKVWVGTEEVRNHL
ncbi:MAG TPA: redoxin domain-containing protein [Candidatus Thermoplasmatota archaeon]|nr:redoxin domain-containing protein [Candidatus Thermoplasmatota archaeon]